MSEKVIMIQISKRTIVFLVIVALLVGSGGTILAMRSGVGGNSLVSNDQYSEMAYFEENYQKMDDIQRAWHRLKMLNMKLI